MKPHHPPDFRHLKLSAFGNTAVKHVAVIAIRNFLGIPASDVQEIRRPLSSVASNPSSVFRSYTRRGLSMEVAPQTASCLRRCAKQAFLGAGEFSFRMDAQLELQAVCRPMSSFTHHCLSSSIDGNSWLQLCMGCTTMHGYIRALPMHGACRLGLLRP